MLRRFLRDFSSGYRALGSVIDRGSPENVMLLALKLVLQILAVGSAALAGILDYVIRDGRTNKFKRIRVWVFIVSAGFLVTSIILTIVEERVNDRREKQLQAQLTKVQKQNDRLQETMTLSSSNLLESQRDSLLLLLEDQRKRSTESSDQLQAAANLLHAGILENIARQRQLVASQQKTFDTVTGSTGYCYLRPFRFINNLNLALINPSSVPQYEIEVRIWDQTHKRSVLPRHAAGQEILSLGTIGPTSGRDIGPLELVAGEVEYFIAVQTRTSTFLEHVYCADTPFNYYSECGYVVVEAKREIAPSGAVRIRYPGKVDAGSDSIRLQMRPERPSVDHNMLLDFGRFASRDPANPSALPPFPD